MGNQNPSNATRRASNTWKQGYSVGYDVFIVKVLKIKLVLNIHLQILMQLQTIMGMMIILYLSLIQRIYQ